ANAVLQPQFNRHDIRRNEKLINPTLATFQRFRADGVRQADGAEIGEGRSADAGQNVTAAAGADALRGRWIQSFADDGNVVNAGGDIGLTAWRQQNVMFVAGLLYELAAGRHVTG